MLKQKTWYWIAVVAVLLAGMAARTFRFGAVPAGFDQDEMSEAYESYSLLQTGADRWGDKLPVYFVSWGSGQNVLQAYATVPVIAAFGISAFSVRFFDLACGLLTLPLFFVVCRKNMGASAALIGTLFLALSPWHIMLSRWAVECNSIPFFMLLGVFSFQEAVKRRSGLLIGVSLVPFALAFYVYGISLLVVPPLVCLLLLTQIHTIKRERRAWICALLVFVVISAPFGFFVWKNYLVKRSYSFEQHLPISIPLIPINRLSQLRSRESLAGQNVTFFTHALQDHTSWSQVKRVPPVPLTVLLLAAIGIFLIASRAIKSKRFHDPFLLWLVVGVPVYFLVPVEINEAINLYTPLFAFAGVGAMAIWHMRRSRPWPAVALGVIGCLFALESARFLTIYFGNRYALQSSEDFHPEMKEVLAKMHHLAGADGRIYLTEQVRLNYINVLFHDRVDPKHFQQTHATYADPDFDNYVFSRDRLAQGSGSIAYAIFPVEPRICESPVEVEVIGHFEVGLCR